MRRLIDSGKRIRVGAVMAAAALWTSGCIMLVPRSGARAEYDGPECDAVRQTHEEAKANRGGSMKKDPSPRAQVLLAVCERREFTAVEYGQQVAQKPYPKITPIDIEELHAGFDDRRFDQVGAALFVINAIDGDEMSKHGGLRDRHDRRGGGDKLRSWGRGDDESTPTEVMLGLANLYATSVDRSKLGQALVALGLPGAAQGAFLSRFDDAKAWVTGQAAAMSAAKKKILVDIPVDVEKKRGEYYQAHQAEYDKIDALLAQADKGGDPAAAAAGLVAVRSEYMAACGTEDCTYDPLYIEVTKKLALLDVARKDAMLARAECSLLTREDSNKNGFAQAVYAATWKEALRAREAYELAKRSEDKGIDRKTMGALLEGVTPIRFHEGDFWRVSTALPNYADVLDAKGVEAESGFIQTVKKKGDKAVVDFKTEYESVDEVVGCVQTGRISRITDDGRLEYEENCQYRSKQVAREKPEPITLDGAEAAKLQPGELLLAEVDKASHAGAVVRTTKDKQVLQIRGDRLKQPAKVKPPSAPKKK